MPLHFFLPDEKLSLLFAMIILKYRYEVPILIAL